MIFFIVTPKKSGSFKRSTFKQHQVRIYIVFSSKEEKLVSKIKFIALLSKESCAISHFWLSCDKSAYFLCLSWLIPLQHVSKKQKKKHNMCINNLNLSRMFRKNIWIPKHFFMPFVFLCHNVKYWACHYFHVDNNWCKISIIGGVPIFYQKG